MGHTFLAPLLFFAAIHTCSTGVAAANNDWPAGVGGDVAPIPLALAAAYRKPSKAKHKRYRRRTRRARQQQSGLAKRRKKKSTSKRKKRHHPNRRRKKKSDKWALEGKLRGGVLLGGMRTGGVLDTMVGAAKGYSRGRVWYGNQMWRLSATANASGRAAVGASLSQLRASATVAARFRYKSYLRITLNGDIAATWRPDWPDLYQPDGAGGLLTTNRNNYWSRGVGAKVASIPIKHHHLVARYHYALAAYQQDPAFDPFEYPMHLTPDDNERHQGALSWKYFGDTWKIGVAAAGFIRNDFFTFARDEGSGRTHAAAGGVAANPLQTIRGIEPELNGELSLLNGRFEMTASYGVELVQDVFQGYYNYWGHHPSLRVKIKAAKNIAVSLSGSASARRYGPRSYAAGANHPALTWGDRRVDYRGRAGLTSRWQLHPKWALLVQQRLTLRRTNYPGYEPGIFPKRRQYTIDWNYTNWQMLAGAEWAPF